VTNPEETARGGTRRIWSEFVPYRALVSSEVISLLQSRKLQVLVAVTPSRLAGVPDLVARYRDAGIDFGLWPMVADEDGRWGSTFNAQLYSDFVLRTADRAGVPCTMAIDLEPPIALTRALLSGNPLSVRRLARIENRESGLQVLQNLMRALRERSCRTIGAVHPILLADGDGQSAWQWLLGTPIDAMNFDAVSPMAYTSLIEGYSRGILARRAATSLLVQTANAARARWQERASISLGSVGIGALGDERPYRDVTELAYDVSLARACGVDDLALFDLGGILQRPEPSAWLDAFVHTPAAQGPRPLARRTRILETGMKRAGITIAIYRRLFH
jgi:hypothetical protein